MDQFYLFVQRIGMLYNQCSYHNELHASDVTNRLCCILDRCGVGLCSQLDAFSAIVAAIIHDVDHNGQSLWLPWRGQLALSCCLCMCVVTLEVVPPAGLSNAFQVKNETDLATRWHGVAVLENNSLEIAFYEMNRPEHNFVAGLSPADRNTFMSNLTAIVLATDMANHFE